MTQFWLNIDGVSGPQPSASGCLFPSGGEPGLTKGAEGANSEHLFGQAVASLPHNSGMSVHWRRQLTACRTPHLLRGTRDEASGALKEQAADFTPQNNYKCLMFGK